MNWPIAALAQALALLPPNMTSDAARIEVLAIGAQESEDWKYRTQKRGGPARGAWQFERAGGVRQVMTHHTTIKHAKVVCAARNVKFDERVVWEALEHDDVLAAAFARLLLWSDPNQLPPARDCNAMWALYLRAWKPGKPHPLEWPARYWAAHKQVLG